jgi:hypothetical protein
MSILTAQWDEDTNELAIYLGECVSLQREEVWTDIPNVSNGVLEIRILEDWYEVTVSLGGRKQYGTLRMSEGGRLHWRGFKDH